MCRKIIQSKGTWREFPVVPKSTDVLFLEINDDNSIAMRWPCVRSSVFKCISITNFGKLKVTRLERDATFDINSYKRVMWVRLTWPVGGCLSYSVNSRSERLNQLISSDSRMISYDSRMIVTLCKTYIYHVITFCMFNLAGIETFYCDCEEIVQAKWLHSYEAFWPTRAKVRYDVE